MPSDHPAPPPPATSFSILVADDEVDLREILRRVLAGAGHRVETASDGAEAWEAFERLRPDLVISDIMMPNGDGIALLKRIRAVAPDAEVVLITGFARTDLVIEALRLGASNFIEKPVRPGELFAHLAPSFLRLGLQAEKALLVAELEAERRRRETEARLVTLGRLLAGLAHEIHNPLTFVRGNAELVKLHVDRLLRMVDAPAEGPLAAVADEVRGLLADLDFGTRRIQDMIRGLKRFSSPARHGAAAVTLADLLDHSVKMAQARKPDRLRLEVDLPDRAVRVLCDPVEIEGCLVNLLVNAYEAMESRGSRVRLSAEVLPFDTGEVGGTVEVAVEDDGPGIPQGIVDEVYTPFFTRKPGGTGLGLSIAYEAVKRNGGQIEIRTAEGEGTRVLVRLPLAPAAP